MGHTVGFSNSTLHSFSPLLPLYLSLSLLLPFAQSSRPSFLHSPLSSPLRLFLPLVAAGRDFYQLRPGAWAIGIPLIIVGAIGVAIGWNRPTVAAQHSIYASLDRDRIVECDKTVKSLTHALVIILIIISYRQSVVWLAAF